MCFPFSADEEHDEDVDEESDAPHYVNEKGTKKSKCKHTGYIKSGSRLSDISFVFMAVYNWLFQVCLTRCP